MTRDQAVRLNTDDADAHKLRLNGCTIWQFEYAVVIDTSIVEDSHTTFVVCELKVLFYDNAIDFTGDKYCNFVFKG